MSRHLAISAIYHAIAELVATGWPIPDSVHVRIDGTVQVSFHDCPEPIDRWVTLFAPRAEGHTHLLQVGTRRVQVTHWNGDWQVHPVDVTQYMNLSDSAEPQTAYECTPAGAA